MISCVIILAMDDTYKGLHSCHNDDNLYEMDATLEREFAAGRGLYQDIPLYNFADNHDVNRLASILRDPAHLYTAYILLYAMPGLPSIYYGSEWGVQGEKANGSDQGIRPRIDLDRPGGIAPDLPKTLQRLAAIRRNSPALLHGSYTKRFIAYKQPFAFERFWRGENGASERVIVAVNPAGHECGINLPNESGLWRDLLNDETFTGESLSELKLYKHWGRILQAV